MGLIRMGPPTELVIKLKEKYNLQDFIETGTYHGNTSVWASRYFQNVITTEYSKETYEKTVGKYGTVNNVNFVLGDSRAVLKVLVPQLNRPALFWLDAHYSGGETYGQDDESPLIEEIQAISISKYDHFILIDDARLFTSPPPQPHRIDQWPSIDEVIEALMSGNHKYYIVIIEDVIIGVPGYAKELVANYCQEVNTKAWEEHGKRFNKSLMKQGYRLVGEGLKLIGWDLLTRLKHLAFNLIQRVMS